jgi:phage shock protein E
MLSPRVCSVLYTLAALLVADLPAFGQYTEDPPATVLKKVTQKEAVLIDVREPSEWDDGHLRDARLVPLGDLRRAAKEDPELLKRLTAGLPKDKPIYAHCKSGGRCLIAAGVLKDLGYDVQALEQGYDELLQAGFPKAADKE